MEGLGFGGWGSGFGGWGSGFGLERKFGGDQEAWGGGWGGRRKKGLRSPSLTNLKPLTTNPANQQQTVVDRWPSFVEGWVVEGRRAGCGRTCVGAKSQHGNRIHRGTPCSCAVRPCMVALPQSRCKRASGVSNAHDGTLASGGAGPSTREVSKCLVLDRCQTPARLYVEVAVLRLPRQPRRAPVVPCGSQFATFKGAGTDAPLQACGGG